MSTRSQTFLGPWLILKLLHGMIPSVGAVLGLRFEVRRRLEEGVYSICTKCYRAAVLLAVLWSPSNVSLLPFLLYSPHHERLRCVVVNVSSIKGYLLTTYTQTSLERSSFLFYRPLVSSRPGTTLVYLFLFSLSSFLSFFNQTRSFLYGLTLIYNTFFKLHSF